MDATIAGTIAQHLELSFDRSDAAWLANGSLLALGRDVDWRLAVPGGIGGALRRGLSGEGFSLTRVTPRAPGAWVRAAANAPGHLTRRAVTRPSGGIVTTRGSFLAAWGDIDIDVTVARRAGAALFGGAGLFLQKISGEGDVVIHASGDLIERDLGSGESITVSTGNLAAFTGEVDYDIVPVGSVRKFLFSNEGLFMTRLTGPGTVLLQSLKRSATTTRRSS